MSDWQASRNGAIEKIKKAAAKSGNELLEEVAEEKDPKKILERSKNTEAVRMIVDRCLENYREGEYSFKQTIDMLCTGLADIK